jgi:hypothetical protein
MRIVPFLLLAVSLFQGIGWAQMFEFTPKDAQRLRGRTLVVVLPDASDAPQVRDPKKIQQQQAWLAMLQRWWEKGARKGWNYSVLPILFCKSTAVDSLPKDKKYLLVENTSLRLMESFWQTLMPADSATVYAHRTFYQQKEKFAFLQLRFAERSESFYTYYFFSQVPTALDYYVAMRSLGYVIQRNIINPKSKTKNIEEEIRNRNSTLKSRNLMVDSVLVNRVGKKFSYIPEEYPFTYSLSDYSSLEKRIMNGDESGALFTMIPISDPIGRGESYLGTAGGGMNTFEKNFYFMQMIVDLGSGNFLYYDKTEEPRVLVRDWKRFTRYTDEGIQNTAP